jgi:hypothetical protein
MRELCKFMVDLRAIDFSHRTIGNLTWIASRYEGGEQASTEANQSHAPAQ